MSTAATWPSIIISVFIFEGTRGWIAILLIEWQYTSLKSFNRSSPYKFFYWSKSRVLDLTKKPKTDPRLIFYFNFFFCFLIIIFFLVLFSFLTWMNKWWIIKIQLMDQNATLGIFNRRGKKVILYAQWTRIFFIAFISCTNKLTKTAVVSENLHYFIFICDPSFWNWLRSSL